jgi:hypothetical protein
MENIRNNYFIKGISKISYFERTIKILMEVCLIPKIIKKAGVL